MIPLYADNPTALPESEEKGKRGVSGELGGFDEALLPGHASMLQISRQPASLRECQTPMSKAFRSGTRVMTRAGTLDFIEEDLNRGFESHPVRSSF
jgi:hypothetical protein